MCSLEQAIAWSQTLLVSVRESHSRRCTGPKSFLHQNQLHRTGRNTALLSWPPAVCRRARLCSAAGCSKRSAASGGCPRGGPRAARRQQGGAASGDLAAEGFGPACFISKRCRHNCEAPSWRYDWRQQRRANSLKWRCVELKTVLGHSWFLSGFPYFVGMITALPASQVSFQVDIFTVFQLFGWMVHPSLCKPKSLSESEHCV